jgi:hypothetical protein
MARKKHTSKAKNAYELLDEVIDLIVDDPRRFNQRDWRMVEGADYYWSNTIDWPDCGTICCVAGWVDMLKSPTPTQSVDSFTTTRGVGRSARLILGLTSAQAVRLFNPDAVDGDFGTDEHARLGVKHIRNFQKKHEKQLKAKKLKVAA